MTAVCLYCQAAIEPGTPLCPHCGQLLDGALLPGAEATAPDSPAAPAAFPVLAEVVSPPPAAPRLPQPGLPLALALMFGLFLAQVIAGIAAVVIWVAPSMAGGGPVDQQQLVKDLQTDGLWLVVVLSTLAVVAFAGATLLVYSRRASRTFALRGITPVQLLLVLMLPLPLQFVISVVTTWLFPLLPEWLQFQPEMEFVDQMSLPLALLVICVFPGFGEEVFFRGLLGRGLTARYGPWSGIFLTSLFFGAMHLVPIQVLATAALGLTFHLTMVSTRSLLAPMMLHFVNNALAVYISRYGEMFPIPCYTSEVETTPWLMLAAAVPTVAFIAYALYATRSQWLLPDGTPWSPGYFSVETPPPGSAAQLRSAPAPLWLVLLLLLQYGIFMAAAYKTVVAAAGAV